MEARNALRIAAVFGAGYSFPWSPGDGCFFTREVRVKSEISRFHAHQVRATFACRWLERGGALVALQQEPGHAAIATTQRYARLTDEVVFSEAKRVHSLAWTVANPLGDAPNLLRPRSSGG